MPKTRKQRRLCFVISPIGKPGSVVRLRADAVLRRIIEPALATLGFRCERADLAPSAGRIDADMVKKVAAAELAIVNLDYLNQNVLFEYGARLAFGRTVIAIAPDSLRRKLPFDVRSFQVVWFPSDIESVADRELRPVRATVRGIAANAGDGHDTGDPCFNIAREIVSHRFAVARVYAAKHRVLTTLREATECLRHELTKDWETGANATSLGDFADKFQERLDVYESRVQAYTALVRESGGKDSFSKQCHEICRRMNALNAVGHEAIKFMRNKPSTNTAKGRAQALLKGVENHAFGIIKRVEEFLGHNK